MDMYDVCGAYAGNSVAEMLILSLFSYMHTTSYRVGDLG